MEGYGNQGKTFKNILCIMLALLLMLAGVFLLKGYFDGRFASVETLRAYISDFGIFGPAMLVLLQALQVVLPVLPGFLGCIVGAGLFGVFGEFLCNYIGISAGSIAAFLLARRLGTAFVKQVVPAEKYKACVEWVGRKKCGFTLVLFLAILLPLAPDDFLCYFSGLTAMSTKKFIWIIILAKPWCILAYCIAAAYFI